MEVKETEFTGLSAMSNHHDYIITISASSMVLTALNNLVETINTCPDLLYLIHRLLASEDVLGQLQNSLSNVGPGWKHSKETYMLVDL